ncbi:hypothetical protein [Paenibacillus alvei]|uniref:hypothetical protein n=1 Tax=Paenibacillus alvei TaxID=44250 RepID=UPI0013DBD089|nr:hypothetical protein [Paenibacillus alvei]NEZ45282.1 hypothetical protein [Paenibacillus alvei]
MNPKEFFPSVYTGTRKSGKTTQLLLRANTTGIPILAHKDIMKNYLERAAKRMGMHNVKVITRRDLERNKVEKVIVDEAQFMLEQFIGTKIDSLSVTSYDIVQLEELQE